MIFSNLNSSDNFSCYPQAIQTALRFISEHNIDKMQPGEYQIDGDKIYAKIFDITTENLENTYPESHKRYCDVQYWQRGRERFGIAPDKQDNPIHKTDEAEDLILYKQALGESFVEAREGCFAVFFPYDIHRPGVQADGPLTFRKCVVKVRVDLL